MPQTWQMFNTSSRARSALHGLGVAEFQRVLRYGDRGFDVAAVQEQLVRRGYIVGGSGVDGIFGRGTEAAVRRFQSDIGAAPSGEVNRSIWNELFRTTAVTFEPTTIVGGGGAASNVATPLTFDEVTIFGRTAERQRADQLLVETPEGSPGVVIERVAKKVPGWAWALGALAVGGVALAVARRRR